MESALTDGKMRQIGAVIRICRLADQSALPRFLELNEEFYDLRQCGHDRMMLNFLQRSGLGVPF